MILSIIISSICWWHSATYWYKLIHTGHPSHCTLESCTARVNDWLLQNGLHLNPSKSKAIAFFNPRSKPLLTLAESIQSTSVAGSLIKLQSSIKSLGVYLDSKMSFNKHVSEVCRASYFHIRALRHIRSSLTTDAAKIVASMYWISGIIRYPARNRVSGWIWYPVSGKKLYPVLSWYPVSGRISHPVLSGTLPTAAKHRCQWSLWYYNFLFICLSNAP